MTTTLPATRALPDGVVKRRSIAVVLCAVAAAVVIFEFHVREVEAQVSAFLSQLLTGHQAAAIPGGAFFYVLEGTPHTFGLQITYDCTSAFLVAPLLVIGAALAMARRIRLGRLMVGIVLAVAVLFAFNLGRIACIAWATANYGNSGFTASHVFVGTGITLVAYVAALVTLIYIARSAAIPPPESSDRSS